MHPTQEQEKAVQLFNTIDSLKLNAFAGTGKTSTLRLMAESTSRRGTYLAFNKAIADEAKKTFPRRVDSRTAHSLAYWAVLQMGFPEDQMTRKLNAPAIADIMELPYVSYGDARSISPAGFGFLIAETVRKFCYSEFEEISPTIVPFPGYLEFLNPITKAYIRQVVSERAAGMWQAMIDPRQPAFPLGFDGFFKLWSLSRPKINSDYILLDEAQDSNPALLSVLRAQEAQLVYVGDRFQQIYEWRDAVNAMEIISTRHQSSLTQSFRFGRDIAEFATKVINLLDRSAVIFGTPGIESVLYCSHPNAVLSRTNAALIGHLMYALDAGYRPYIVGGISELKWMLEDVMLLKLGRPGTHPEFFGFNNWHEVEEFIQQPEGASLVTFVRMVGTYGENQILQALTRTASNKRYSDIELSTAHKAKGLEWNSVILAEDFPEPQLVLAQNENALKAKGCVIVMGRDGQKYAVLPEEIRLLYVAATRAKNAVRLPRWCYTFFGVLEDDVRYSFNFDEEELNDKGDKISSNLLILNK